MRIAIWKIEAKLLALLLWEILALTVVADLAVAQLVFWCAFLWRAELATYFELEAAAAFIVFVLCANYIVRAVPAEACDEPLREPLDGYPELQRAVSGVALALKRPCPRAAAFLLSLVTWRRFGCDASRLLYRREIPIPVSYLGVWPVLALRCHIAHFLVRRRPKRWLFYAVQQSLARLLRESHPRAPRSQRPKPRPLVTRYLMLLGNWGLLTDIEADSRIVRLFGDSAVATWICQTHLISQVAPGCLQRMVQPAVERGVLLPIAASCSAYFGLIEPGWLTFVEAERVKAQRSQPANPFAKALVMRLAALPSARGRVHDPRPAADLLPALEILEEKLLRHETGCGSRALHRTTIAEIGKAVMVPMMREEVDRNTAILKNPSILDIPDLLREAPALASAYQSDPRYLLAPQQRQALVPSLLAAFLTLELERTGWRVAYVVGTGLTLERGGRTVCPHRVIEALRKGEMSRETFADLVRLDT